MGRLADLFANQHVTLPEKLMKQVLSFDRNYDTLEEQVQKLKSDNLHLSADKAGLVNEKERLTGEVQRLDAELAMLKKQNERQKALLDRHKQAESPPAEVPDNPKSHRCDSCGSLRLKRSGSRPDPHFQALGIKEAIYRCLDCGASSGFTNDEST